MTNPSPISVEVEELSSDAFRPFGAVIQPGWQPAVFDGLPYRMVNMGFETDGRPALYVIRYLRREMTESRFERHLTMTETRICLSGGVVVMVAAATSSRQPPGLPEPESVRAFLLRTGDGVLLKRGTWHALDCFAVFHPYADCAFMSELEAEAELAAFSDPARLERTDIVDFSVDALAFNVTDPRGLLSGG